MTAPSQVSAFNYASPPFVNWPIKQITSTYTLLPSDNGYIINCASGTFTINLVPTAPFQAGFCCWVWNTSNTATDVITLQGNASQTIDASSSIAVRKSSGTQIIFDGVRWQVGARTTMRGYSENINNNSSYAAATNTGAMALGQGAAASGTYSTAIGFEVTASASNSFAAGINSGASGSQAVTGSGAMALGGSRAAGTDSLAAAVANNTSTYGATGANAVAIGYQARATQTQAFAIGSLAYANGNNSLAIGGTAFGGPLANAAGAIAIGSNNVFASPDAAGASSIAFGDGTNTISAASASMAVIGGNTKVVGQIAFGAGESGANAQICFYSPKTQTTNNVAKVLVNNTFASGTAAGTGNQVILPNNSAYAFTGTVVARRQAAGGTESAAWKIEGLIRREGTAASTTLVASTVTAISNAPGWTLALSADTTNGGLAITATGAAATNIRWVATVQTSEVIYA